MSAGKWLVLRRKTREPGPSHGVPSTGLTGRIRILLEPKILGPELVARPSGGLTPRFATKLASVEPVTMVRTILMAGPPFLRTICSFSVQQMQVITPPGDEDFH